MFFYCIKNCKFLQENLLLTFGHEHSTLHFLTYHFFFYIGDHEKIHIYEVNIVACLLRKYQEIKVMYRKCKVLLT